MLANMPLTAIGGGAGQRRVGLDGLHDGQGVRDHRPQQRHVVRRHQRPREPALPGPAARAAGDRRLRARRSRPRRCATTFEPRAMPRPRRMPSSDRPTTLSRTSVDRRPSTAAATRSGATTRSTPTTCSSAASRAATAWWSSTSASSRNVANPPVHLRPDRALLRLRQLAHHHREHQTGFVYANGTRSGTCGTAGGPHIVNVAEPRRAGRSPAATLTDGYTHDSQCLVYQGPDVAHQGKSICINSNEDTAHHQRRHQPRGGGAHLPHRRTSGSGLHPPGLDHRRPPLLPARRRAGRAELRPQHQDLHLGPDRPRRAGDHGLPPGPDAGHRPPAVHPRQLRLPVELPRRPAHPGDQGHPDRAAHRGRASSTSSRQRQPRASTARGRTIRSSAAASWPSPPSRARRRAASSCCGRCSPTSR